MMSRLLLVICLVLGACSGTAKPFVEPIPGPAVTELTNEACPEPKDPLTTAESFLCQLRTGEQDAVSQLAFYADWDQQRWWMRFLAERELAVLEGLALSDHLVALPGCVPLTDYPDSPTRCPVWLGTGASSDGVLFWIESEEDRLSVADVRWMKALDQVSVGEQVIVLFMKSALPADAAALVDWNYDNMALVGMRGSTPISNVVEWDSVSASNMQMESANQDERCVRVGEAAAFDEGKMSRYADPEEQNVLEGEEEVLDDEEEEETGHTPYVFSTRVCLTGDSPPFKLE